MRLGRSVTCLDGAAEIYGTTVNDIYRKAQLDNSPAVRIGHPKVELQLEIEIKKPHVAL